jgi:hypothetical protein
MLRSKRHKSGSPGYDSTMTLDWPEVSTALVVLSLSMGGCDSPKSESVQDTSPTPADTSSAPEQDSSGPQDSSEPTPEPDTGRGDWAEVDPSTLHTLYQRSYHPEWSGQVFLHLAPGHYVLADDQPESNDSKKRAFHLSAYDHESRIPLLVHLPTVSEPAVHTEEVYLAQVGATLFELLALSPPEGVSDAPLPLPEVDTPGTIVVLVYDALPWARWETTLGTLPNHAALRATSQEFSLTRLGHMSSSTTVSHAVLATGQTPSKTGIPINHARTTAGAYVEVFDGDIPDRLLVPTVADLHDLAHDNEAIIASYCSQSRAAIAMAGHGTSHPGGDADIVVWQQDHHGAFTSNTEVWALPEYLAELGPQGFLDADPAPTFMGETLTTNKDLFRSPYNVRISGQAVSAILEAEDFGADDVTDLLMVNIKVLDNIAHHWGTEEGRYDASMNELDAFIGRFKTGLDTKLGDNYVLILTSDHGFGPPMERPRDAPDERRHLLSELRDTVDTRLGVPGALQDVQYLNGYLDTALMEAAGISNAQACDAFLAEPWVVDCLTAEEVQP